MNVNKTTKLMIKRFLWMKVFISDNYSCVGFEDLPAVVMKSTTFWNIILYSPLSQPTFRKIEALCSSETSAAWEYIAEQSI
jgi:hypothetical protein